MGKASRLKRGRRQPLPVVLPSLLRWQMAKGGLPIEENPPDQKISKALLDVLAPYLEGNEPFGQFRAMVSLSAMAWNLSATPAAEREQEVAAALGDLGKHLRPDVLRTFEGWLRAMIETKQQLHPHDHRMVAHWEVENRGDQYFVRAVSVG